MVEWGNMNNDKDFKDTLAKIKSTFRLREGSLAIFLIISISFKVTGFATYFRQLDWVIFILAVWFVSAYIFRFLIGRKTTAAGLINLYLIYDILVELPLLSFIVYAMGGVEWIGGMLFLFPIVYTSIVFRRNEAFLVYVIASIYYVLLVLLPYFNIISFKPFFNLGTNFYQNSSYVMSNIIITLSVFYLVGWAANLIADLLGKRTAELEKTKKELEKEKTSLEVKVQDRTKELEKEKTSLEVKVRDRTKEIEKERASLEERVKERTQELQKRIEELEKFHKITVGRELKMAKLKKEIKKLNEELEKYKS